MPPAALNPMDMPEQQPPLIFEASATSTHPREPSASLPSEVVTCLKNARFLHLATCSNQTPHISLMNYTYLPLTQFSSTPIIIMTTNPMSRKTINLLENPKVSLLVHDWVSHRPRTTSVVENTRGGSPTPQPARSSLASLLLSMNTSAMSRISATINGEARIVEQGSEEEKWFKEMHLENNTFGDRETNEANLLGTSPAQGIAGDGGRGCFIEDEEVRVVVVKIKDGRIADWKGGVQDWVITDNDSHMNEHQQMVNGT